MEKVARPRTVLERCFMMLVVMAMVLSLFASAAPPVNASTLPSNTQTQVNPPADTPEMADAVYYKYPFQNPLLSAEDRVNNLISLMTLDEKIALLHQFSGAIIRLGVPQFRTGTEGLHGLSWLGPATVFPQGCMV